MEILPLAVPGLGAYGKLDPMRSETDSKRSNYHPKRSYKAPIIKTQVIAKRVMGHPKAKIAADLGIAYNTVNGIIEQSGIDKVLAQSELETAKLIPKSIETIDHLLDKDNLEAAKFILDPVWNRERLAKDRRQSLPDTSLTQALAVYIDNKVITPDTDSNKIVDVDPKPTLLGG